MTAIIALHARGLARARVLARQLEDATVHAPVNLARAGEEPYTSVTVLLTRLFDAGMPIVGIMASGILIRVLAGHLADKRREPPVIAVSEDGRSVVPLLGGHHGANKLAEAVAKITGGTAAITTASESAFGIALDEPPAGWTVANPTAAKAIAAALLDGRGVALTVESGDGRWLAPLKKHARKSAKGAVLVTDRAMKGNASTLVLHPPTLAIGVGCERGASGTEMIRAVRAALKKAGLSENSAACIASLDLKADETAVHDTAESLGVPARFFTAARLERERPRLKNPSKTVFAAVGCHGVAEGAALAAAGRGAALIVPKITGKRVTVAIARAARDIDPTKAGRARGTLSVVGLGPGTPELLAPRARTAVARATDIVGYGLYLDFLDKDDGKHFHDFPLGAETERADHALKLAAQGRDVALVASGDPGIYALATLVFERASKTKNDAVRRVAIEVIPGVSSMLAGAALAGAPLGHDFAVISLSDLLTPWDVIERRLEAAAAGDFAVVLFNPASKRRQWQLTKARDILLGARPAETPVALCHDIGREAQRLDLTTLGKLRAGDADMTTLVIIGSRETRTIDTAGRRWVYTPRGYARRERP
ncbi:MAG TPA: precorrin-3B C(17)-methyltransferase [Alphaproteobacteria bacterium]|jgi:cobalt-precorrin 5A hydrolase/precorrin-3B C17-methyltransferase|nr:precorrin-3B C(17)-methyltransferase [Alphaproteobacteria bacterium]